MNLELRIKNNKKLLNCFIVILFFCFFVSANAALALDCSLDENKSKPECLTLIQGTDCSQINCATTKDAYCCGDYELNDFVNIAIRIAAWILGITGSLALLFFIYGGFMFLISAGSSERVQKAKQIIIGAVVGVVIVLTSFMIIDFIITSLTGSNQIDGKEWFKLK